MLLSEAIEALRKATIADGHSRRTADGYRQNLSYLVKFLGDRPVDQISLDDLRSYAFDLRSRVERYAEHPARERVAGRLSPDSVASYIRAVKRLFNWLHEEGAIASNPAHRLANPKPGRHAPKGISKEDFAKLMGVTAGDTINDRRNCAIIRFLADTGCRRGGLEWLRVEDVDLRKMIATLTEKGDKTRLVPFSPHTRDAVARWLEVRPTDRGPWLFLNLGTKGEERMTGEAVRQLLDRLAEKAGCEGPVNPHSFRHAFAREWLLNGGDMGPLADVLGHSSIVITQMFYAIFKINELQRLHSRFSPVARMEDDRNEN
jgi:site-specific recombinase XerD